MTLIAYKTRYKPILCNGDDIAVYQTAILDPDIIDFPTMAEAINEGIRYKRTYNLKDKTIVVVETHQKFLKYEG